MEAIKQKPLDGATATYKTSFEFLLNNPVFLLGLNHVKSLKPVTVPLHVAHNGRNHKLSLRRTRRNHSAYLLKAEQNGVSFERAVVNVADPETKRFYLVTEVPEGVTVKEFLQTRVPATRKLRVLRSVANELAKLNKSGLRHGDLLPNHVYVGKGDHITLTNPELDEEIVEHMHGDFDQLREMLLTLERDLDYEPPQLWEAVKKENYFKNMKD